MSSKATPINSQLSGQVLLSRAEGGIGRAIAAMLSAAGMTTAVLARSASEKALARRLRPMGVRLIGITRRAEVSSTIAPFATPFRVATWAAWDWTFPGRNLSPRTIRY